MDIEWVSWFHRACPTQISALRVTSDWREDSRLDKLICPESERQFAEHMAFTGYDRDDFRRAPDAASVLAVLSSWLRPEDALCWWSAPTAAMFAAVWRDIFHAAPPFRLCLITPSVQDNLHRFRLPLRGSAYRIAEAAGILPTGQEHRSADDVNVIRTLLGFLKADPVKIRNCILPEGAVNRILHEQYNRNDVEMACRFVLDLTHRKAHLASCGRIPEDSERRSMATMEGMIRSLMLPCSCCSEEYWRLSHSRADENIRKMGLNYIFVEKSRLFHKPSCLHVQRMPFPEIHGCIHYDTAVAHGFRPCGWCRPSPEDEREAVRKIEGNHGKEQSPSLFGRDLNRFEKNAVRRHEQAVRERAAIQSGPDGSVDRDALVLSRSGYAFWAADGYQTFHLRSCPKLKGLSHLHGYARFSDARRIGLTPCKICRPSEKNDILASIPLEQRIRKDETVQQIDVLCDSYGWKHEMMENEYIIETSVAKWKLMTDTLPLEVWHMPNGRDQYHRQHRTFLSMTDTVNYIRRHDESPDPSGPERKKAAKLEQMILDSRDSLMQKTMGRRKALLAAI